MKILFLMIIKSYWLLIPESKRRKCLFKKSCSNYVYEMTRKKGLISGLKALRFRVQNCNPDYSIIQLEEELILVTKTNVVLREEDLNTSILN